MKLIPIFCAALFLNAVPARSQDSIIRPIERVLSDSKALEQSVKSWENAPAKARVAKPMLWTRHELPEGLLLETPAHWIVADEAMLKQIAAGAQAAGNPGVDIVKLRMGTTILDADTMAMVGIAVRPRQLGELEKLTEADLAVIADLQSGKLERKLGAVGYKLVAPVKARLIPHELGATLFLRCELEDDEQRYVMDEYFTVAGTREVLMQAAWPVKNDLAERAIGGIQKSLRLKK